MVDEKLPAGEVFAEFLKLKKTEFCDWVRNLFSLNTLKISGVIIAMSVVLMGGLVGVGYGLGWVAYELVPGFASKFDSIMDCGMTLLFMLMILSIIVGLVVQFIMDNIRTAKVIVRKRHCAKK